MNEVYTSDYKSTNNPEDTKNMRDAMIDKAYKIYTDRQARAANAKLEHAGLVKKKRRAKNKAARQSRKANR